MRFPICLALVLLAGCKIPEGKIISVTQSVIGIKIGENPATQTPELQIGFFRSTFQIVPTLTTNGVISAPKVNSSLALTQKAFTTVIAEDFETSGADIPQAPSAARLMMMSRTNAVKPAVKTP